jgi:hypothetical protein
LDGAINTDHVERVQLLLGKEADAVIKGGFRSGSEGAMDDNDAIIMAAVLGSTGILATLLNYRLGVPVAALVGTAAVGNEVAMAMPLFQAEGHF